MATPVVIGSGAGRRFAWNLSANVGVSSPNNADDVQLVQLGYACAQYGTNFDAATRAIFATVMPGAPYSGQENDPLTRAIRAHQKSRGGTQDGHVSVIANLTTPSYDAAHPYMMMSLNNLILDQLKSDFPRIDKHAKCPALLRAVATKACAK